MPRRSSPSASLIGRRITESSGARKPLSKHDNLSPQRTCALPRLALTAMEAPEALGVSHDFFHEHIACELRWVRRGRKKLVSVRELDRWLEENSSRVFGEAA